MIVQDLHLQVLSDVFLTLIDSLHEMLRTITLEHMRWNESVMYKYINRVLKQNCKNFAKGYKIQERN